MTISSRADYQERDTILKLLSDDENAKVSTAEGAVHLKEGDEYVDLEQLDRGIQRASAEMPNLTSSRMIPRNALHDETWAKIVALLGA